MSLWQATYIVKPAPTAVTTLLRFTAGRVFLNDEGTLPRLTFMLAARLSRDREITLGPVAGKRIIDR